MPSYREWISQIDIHIDYYSAFIKAWIAFNSWYRSEFGGRTDRSIIDKLKSDNNRFKGYIETLLDKNNTTHEASTFCDNLSNLQSALVSAAIVTQERNGSNQQISFSEIAISNPKQISECDYRSTHYRVQRTGQSILIIVHKKKHPSDELFHFEQVRYDEAELDVHADFIRLGTEKQGQCKAIYRDINPYVIESVLCKDRDNNIVFIEERAGSMSIKKTSKKSKERFFGLVWSEPFVMGMRAEGIVIAVNVVKNG